MILTKKWKAVTYVTEIELASGIAVGGLTAATSAASDIPSAVHVVEHAVTDTGQQLHPPADSLGDVLGFHNPIYNAADQRQIATDNGYCIRTVGSGKTEWECTWTTLLAGGNLAVEGPCVDDGTETTLSITGGTGKHTGATGSVLPHARGNPVGSEYDFVFDLGHH